MKHRIAMFFVLMAVVGFTGYMGAATSVPVGQASTDVAAVAGTNDAVPASDPFLGASEISTTARACPLRCISFGCGGMALGSENCSAKPNCIGKCELCNGHFDCFKQN